MDWLALSQKDRLSVTFCCFSEADYVLYDKLARSL